MPRYALFCTGFSLSLLGRAHGDSTTLTVPDDGVCALQATSHLHVQDTRDAEGEAGMSKAQLPAIVVSAFQKVAEDARSKLVAGSAKGASPLGADVFSAIDVSLPLAPPILRFSPGSDYVDGEKNIVGMQVMSKSPCLTYGLGVSPAASHMTSSFETQMANVCETHAFDCTVSATDPNVYKKPFHFHQWCIGRSEDTSKADDSMSKTGYLKEGDVKAKSMEFKSLAQTMHELSHKHIDLLKFDIEGFEWKLFEDDILHATDANLPAQLSFELHTQGANKFWVPPENVAGKGYEEVNSLFLKLFDLGYRVASKQVHSLDDRCAEFILVKL
mmetsp:Transcript_104584/g.196915  ORF Transcript_104584/g.196915 Transcript_104584/m.196915 type:complete len:329 (+) Transcript_104584:67-1053(+)